MRLYLIRHTHAGQGNPDDPQDHLRPLSLKGRRQAEMLATACNCLELSFDRLFSSPYTRAMQTATPLLHHTKGRTLETLSELTTDAYGELLKALKSTLEPGDSTVALVGHEPYLSELVSLLLTGDAQTVRLHFRKGMMVALQGPLTAGGLELRSALTPKQLAALTD